MTFHVSRDGLQSQGSGCPYLCPPSLSPAGGESTGWQLHAVSFCWPSHQMLTDSLPSRALLQEGGPGVPILGEGPFPLCCQFMRSLKRSLSGPSPSLGDPTRSYYWIPGTHKLHHQVKVTILWAGGPIDRKCCWKRKSVR